MSEGEFGNGSFFARRSAIEYMNSTLAAELGSAKEDSTVGDLLTKNLTFISDSMLNGNLRAFPNLGFVNQYLASISTNAGLIFTGELSAQEAMQNIVDEIQPLADANPYVPYKVN